MVWHLNVPKVLLLYWDGSPASELHLLTVKSFQKLNPDWKVKLYRPTHRSVKKTWTTQEQKVEYTGRNYWDDILALPNIDVVSIDFRSIGFPNDAPEVIKSDYLRLHLLSTCGGVWSDMDIFYLQPMEQLECNTKENSKCSEFLVYDTKDNYYPIGFLMSSGRSDVFTMLRDRAKKTTDLKNYQAIGAILYKSCFISPKYLPVTSHVMKMNTVYPFPWDKTRNLVGEDTAKNHESLTRYTIGIHWYNGDSLIRKYQNGEVASTNCLLAKLVKLFESN